MNRSEEFLKRLPNDIGRSVLRHRHLLKQDFPFISRSQHQAFGLLTPRTYLAT